jgi:hypothetical protein
MLDTREFDALPILSDALLDGGCTDSELVAQCRDPELKSILAERIVNLVYSEETAAAVRWLEQFARDIGYEGQEPPTYSYEQVIDIGHQGVSDGHMYFWSDDGANFFRDGEDNQREFFRNWSLVTGIAVPDAAQQSIIVSCAC